MPYGDGLVYRQAGQAYAREKPTVPIFRDTFDEFRPKVNYRSRRSRRKWILWFVRIFAVASIGFVVWGLGIARTKSRAPPPPPLRKALVIASFTEQDVSWLDSLSSDWEVYRYIMDDFYAPLHVPRNVGREAMAYLTFIIDHYHNLPDHMVFLHGHEQSWHQPEPLAWKLESLNHTALSIDKYVPLRCHQVPTARPDYLVDLTKPRDELGCTEKIIPAFWRMTRISEKVPRHLAFPCCGQFAVTKDATLRHSREWWIGFREPMLRDPDDLGLGMDDYELWMLLWIGWGYVYEKLWHVVFGMPPVFIPNEDHCFRTQWSDGVHCNKYPTPPFGDNYPLMDGVYCWQPSPTDPEPHFEYRVYSMCNVSTWQPERPVWYATDPGQPNRAREDPCPGFDMRAHALTVDQILDRDFDELR